MQKLSFPKASLPFLQESLPITGILLLWMDRQFIIVYTYTFTSYGNALYYIDTNLLLENTLLVEFIQNHIWDSSQVFSISSLLKISMISQISMLYGT